MKIRVCIPFYREFEWVKPLIQKLSKSDRHNFETVYATGSNIADMKNKFFTNGEDKILDYNYFLIHDSDQKMSSDDVYQMISHDKEVVGAPVVMQGGVEYACGMFESVGKLGKRFKPTDGMKGLHLVDYTGDGLILVRRDVLVKYVEKYKTFDFFRTYPIKRNDYYRHPTWDIGFCAYLKNLKVKVWCDFDVKVEHRLRDSASINWDINNIREVDNMETKQALIEPEANYNLELTGRDVAVIVSALQKAPYNVADPIITKIMPQMHKNFNQSKAA